MFLGLANSFYGVVIPCCLVLTANSSVWNDCGHRVVAAIAYEVLSAEERASVTELLSKHPAARHPTYWSEHAGNSENLDLNLFMNAALFPDDVKRSPQFRQYNIGYAHYVNYRVYVDQEGHIQVLPPLQDLTDDEPHGDLLESLSTNLKLVQDQTKTDAKRAVALSWIFHQVGDLHQPLHNVARFCEATPNGDRGGNEIRFGQYNLHAYWDWALGDATSPDVIQAMAWELIAEHPRSQFEECLQNQDIRAWSREGVSLALQYVYRDLDPAIVSFPEIPVVYEADARSVAKRQCALAGYRLADLLRSVVSRPIRQPDVQK